ncbi:hypothetical protein C5B91_06325 [Haloferax sp. Atlit-10N]|uniref:Uncharacterized protein n=3 Tax=Haloferax TaxID=2251 RepID=A0A871BGE9_HALGI|nr:MULTISPECIES: hypothetical protein [Haloferax]ELZ70408.1 hypothetical protein C457_08154 [Haloferax prahovense DSM 18310]ELZ77771.1 hypothetical protein C454_14805 [Haloferax gibbonsii ATCC 33959]QOS11743.1 uncharacterized protein HfgLR_08010 [Haloferax gibbonsii]RDZ45452.1 hypothetical protein C5B86_06785 [Haloferax sp. Atlit-19N]RDZ47273.1 hypothetical protein C5B87_06320 [Haloferax sp. Atlit-16N]
MAYNQQSAFGIPSTWEELNADVTAFLFTVTLLIGAASLALMAGGDPETMAVVALTGVAVVLLGTALVRLSENLRTAESSPF